MVPSATPIPTPADAPLDRPEGPEYVVVFVTDGIDVAVFVVATKLELVGPVTESVDEEKEVAIFVATELELLGPVAESMFVDEEIAATVDVDEEVAVVVGTS